MDKLRIILLLLLCKISFSQNSSVDQQILSSFNQYRSSFVQEKMYIHTDKGTYFSREILWYKMYYVDAGSFLPASLSKIAYIEILDQNNKPVFQEKASLKPGEAMGSIYIPQTIASGNYKFRAYTNWMKNFDPELYFEKVIHIINPQNPAADSIRTTSQHYDIQLFPEGGNLVRGIASLVGFRVTDAFGKGLEFEGTLINSNGDSLVKFMPSHFGLGRFSFTPLTGLHYKVIIRFKNGDLVVRDVPDAYSQGCVMNVSELPDKQIKVVVKGSESFSEEMIYLLVHGKNSVIPVRSGALTNNSTAFVIKPEDLEDGISVFTVFDKTGQPVCERLHFKYPEKKCVITSAIDSEFFTRKEIVLDVTSTDQSGKYVPTDMSMAVYRLDSIQEMDETDITSYLYLVSELGMFESPGYYFADKEELRAGDLDNLMLTHGWRKFVWKNILQTNKRFEFPPEMNGHIIQGNLVDSKSGRPVPGTDVYLSVPSARTEFKNTTSDAAGHVRFELNDFYGSNEVIVQTNPNKDSSSHIELTRPFSHAYSSWNLPPFSGFSKTSRDLLRESIYTQVQQVYNSSSFTHFTEQYVDTNTFYVRPDEKYMLDDYVRFQSMEEVLREYVHSVNVTKRSNGFHLYAFDNATRTFFEGEPLILIDGVPFFSSNELFNQDPLKIRRLDLVNKMYALGYQTYEGIINLTTFHGNLDGITLDPHALVLDYPGIPYQREFFAPVYDTEAQFSDRKPDYRTLLYWSSKITADKDGKSHVRFYTSDLPGRYVMVIQGLSELGTPGSKKLFFDVKKSSAN